MTKLTGRTGKQILIYSRFLYWLIDSSHVKLRKLDIKKYGKKSFEYYGREGKCEFHYLVSVSHHRESTL